MGNDINTISGIEFENLCQNLIENMGFSVETIKASGDGGIGLNAYNHEPVFQGNILFSVSVILVVLVSQLLGIYTVLLLLREQTKVFS